MGEVVQALIADIFRPYRSIGSETAEYVKTEAALGVVKLRHSARRSILLCACGVGALYLIGLGISLALVGGLILMAIEFNSKTASLTAIGIGIFALSIGLIALIRVSKGWHTPGLRSNHSQVSAANVKSSSYD